MTEPTVVPDNDVRVAPPAPEDAFSGEKPRVRVHPIGDVIEPSKSRRGKTQMSATKGYTNADMTAMGLDPTKVYTHITKAQAEAGKAARAARTQKYYQAALDEKAQRESDGLSF
jgi:hypothetical protein